jgi:hypothetical protein
LSRNKRYVEFTSTGIHVDIERYLDTPEGKEALDRMDQAGKALGSKKKRKKVPKPFAIRYRYKPDGRIIGWSRMFGHEWRVWGRYQKLSDAEHVFEKMTRGYGHIMDLELECPPPDSRLTQAIKETMRDLGINSGGSVDE